MKAMIIKNNIIPPKRFYAITIWPFIFTKKVLSDMGKTHEIIHCEQQEEMLILPFFLWYGIEWLIRLILYRNFDEAYRNISFEQEAYLNECDYNYVPDRKFFAWLKFLTKKSFNTKK